MCQNISIKNEELKKEITSQIDSFKEFLNQLKKIEDQYKDFVEKNNLINYSNDKMTVYSKQIIDNTFLNIDFETNKNNENQFIVFFTNTKKDILFDSVFQINSTNKLNKFNFEDIFDEFWSDFYKKKNILSQKEKDEIKILIYFGYRPVMNIIEVFNTTNLL